MENKKQKTAVEYLEERLNLSLGNELKSLRGFFVIAKEMEKSQIEKAIEDGYAGCCGKKTTVKLKDIFWGREEKWDESRVCDIGDDYLGKEKTFEEYYNETYK